MGFPCWPKSFTKYRYRNPTIPKIPTAISKWSLVLGFITEAIKVFIVIMEKLSLSEKVLAELR
jgi:hypothetical protein